MRAAILALIAAAAPKPVALLPVGAPELPPETARAAADSMAAALPPPFRAMDLDAGAVREHLGAAGPACRADLACLCLAAGLSEGQLALDLAVAPAGPAAWAVDLGLVAPCDGQRLDRRAEIVPPGLPALRRFLDAALPAVLRGRDLPRPPRVAPPAVPSRKPTRPSSARMAVPGGIDPAPDAHRRGTSPRATVRRA